MNFSVRKCCRQVAIALALAACVPLAHAGYMQAKAQLAQVLLQHAWQKRLQDGAVTRPWPWADTAPVARLQVPRLGVSEIILSGDSGRTLAFGPGWAESSSMPGEPGLSVISAHRDTHFSFLRHLAIGDAIDVQGSRSSRRYAVATLRVVDARQEEVQMASDLDALILVTCFPFDAIDARGPLRLVVTAVPLVTPSAQLSAEEFVESSLSSIGAP